MNGRVYISATSAKFVAGFGLLTGLCAVAALIVTSVNLGVANHPRILTPSASVPCPNQDNAEARRLLSYNLRMGRAVTNAAKPIPCQTPNGDEAFYDKKLGSFTKGLQHNAVGEVDPNQFAQFVTALSTNNHDALPRAAGAQRAFVSPQAGLAYDLISGDSHTYYQPAAPAFNSTELGGEYIEVAWMAVLRDIPFQSYPGNPLAIQAAAELNALGADFTGPKPVSEANLFRGNSQGCLVGPYLSQYFYKPINYGYHRFQMKIEPYAPALDFMTDYGEFLNIQNGKNPAGIQVFSGPSRYLLNGRDIGNWVHRDVLWQAYHMAALSLLTMGAPYNPTNPYLQLMNQEGFATFGEPDMITKVTEVSTHALHAVWNQKWRVHRRQRPEAFGGRIHVHKTMGASYPIAPAALNSAANSIFFAQHGTYLLPQVFPEGSPMHPAYGAGHATVAGACVTVLKAFFDCDWVIPYPLEPDGTGANLVASPHNLTVGGELDKLAHNVALGRNIAGVHWRTDSHNSILLGEQVAIDFLRDYKKTYNERFVGWSFLGFEGQRINL